MQNPRDTYNTGIEYFHNAVSFSKSNKFGELITYNIISMSAEYLMSAMLYKNGIDPYGSGDDNIISTLESNKLISAEVKEKAILLKTQCSCKKSSDSISPNMEELIFALREIKQCADREFKPTLV